METILFPKVTIQGQYGLSRPREISILTIVALAAITLITAVYLAFRYFPSLSFRRTKIQSETNSPTETLTLEKTREILKEIPMAYAGKKEVGAISPQKILPHSDNKIEENPHPKVDFHSLYDEAKLTERKSLHEAFRNAYQSFLKRNERQNVHEIINQTSFQGLENQFLDKIQRLFVLLFVNKKNMTIERAADEARNLLETKSWFSPKSSVETQKSIESLAEQQGILPSTKSSKLSFSEDSEGSSSFFQKYMKEISGDLSLLQNQKSYLKESETLKSLFEKIRIECEAKLETSEDYRRSTDKLLAALRSAMNTTLYKIKRTDETDPLVHFLHNLAFAGYHDPLVSDHFQSLGRKVHQVTQISTDHTLVEKLEQTWKKMHEGGIPIDTVGSIKNFKSEEVLKLGGEYTSYAISGLMHEGSFDPLDERKFPDNIPGSLYEEKCEFLQKNQKMISCKIRSIYTCNPTIGFEAAPEFRTVLQAMENRYFTKIKEDPYPYLFWIYTNLQDLSNKEERPHAQALMHLNEEYPLSYRGISVTQNSPFYVKPAKEFNENYAKVLIEQLLNPTNFTLIERKKTEKEGLYYFPKKDQKRWCEAIPLIVSAAYQIVEKNSEKQTAEDLSRAFKELVHIGIIRFHQQLTLEVLQTGTKNEEIQFIDSRVCKSCIDRGSKNTLIQFLALLNAKENEDTLILGAFHGRPLLVARRLMLEQYTLALFSLLRVIPPGDLEEYAKTIGEKSAPTYSSLNSLSIRLLKN